MIRWLKNIPFDVVLTISVFFVLLCISIVSEDLHGGSDSINHYLIAKYSWSNPSFFLDHWGKPFYTLVASFFAQFGVIGIKVFTTLVVSLSAFYSYRILKELVSVKPYFLILFLFSFSIYYELSFTSLTEPFFSLVLIFSGFLFIKKKWFWSAVIISFLPFVRSEGFILLLVWAMALMWFRQYKYVGFLLTGILLYSVIGGLYYGDFYWIYTKYPYPENSIYGNGEFWHFANKFSEWSGTVLPYVFLGGFFYMLYRFLFISKRKDIPEGGVLLLAGCVLIFFFGHSYVWYKGSSASLGLVRVMACVVPCMAVVAGYGIVSIVQLVKVNQLYIHIILFGITTGLFYHNFQYFDDQYISKIGKEERVIKEMANWYKNQSFKDKKVYAYDPNFPFFSALSIYDKNKYEYPGRKITEKIQEGEVLVWDSHFGANEGKTLFEDVFKDSTLTPLNWEYCNTPHRTLGGFPYDVIVFEKVQEGDPLSIDTVLFEYYDTIDSEFQCYFNDEYSEILQEDIRLVREKNIEKWNVMFTYKIPSSKSFVLVMAYTDGEMNPRYESKVIEGTGDWNIEDMTFTLPPQKSDSTYISLYYWNKDTIDVRIQDVSIISIGR